MADAIKSIYPQADVDLLVQKRVFELVEDHPNINKVHSIEKVTSKAVKAVCKAGNYDTAIAVFPTFSIACGMFKSGIKYRVGTAYRWYSFLFNLKHHGHRNESIKHESSYNVDLLEELNIFYQKKLSVSLQVKPEHLHNAIAKLKVTGFNKNERFIVIHIPSLGSAKVWSDDNFKQLLNLIIENVNNCYQVVLSGTIDDENQVKHIVSELPENNRIFCIFNLNLKELAAIISKSLLFIGNSTGPIHIAAAVGTYVVGLYSPVRVESPVRWGPLTDKKKIFVPAADDFTRDVMNEISPKDVYNFINNYIENLPK